MATIDQVLAKGLLEVVPLPSWEQRLAIRPLWATPELLDLIEEMPVLHELMLGSRTAYEHLWQFFSDFRCSARPGAGDLRTMLPTEKGIWKMHPPELRVYGWCPGTHCFVAVTMALESETKNDRTLNGKKRDQVLGFIKANGLESTVNHGGYLAVFPIQ